MYKTLFITVLAFFIATMSVPIALASPASHYTAALSPTLDAQGNPALDIIVITREGDLEHFMTVTADLLTTANNEHSTEHTFTGDFNGAAVYVIEANALQLSIGPNTAGQTYYYIFDICSGEIIDAYTIEP